ncbi:MAG TPA: glycerophosphodiester phosphodiesterase family protein [Bacillota bacterium]|nr:glycerophosphodiester phosphodiesterase family protein [Bacillota bacterium]HPQ61837.1 glycerophosphodiester phosphodiesterase family protein [Bacillota bacterium]HRX91186.1 glycerophosphodiester phosphodiesterase family protein [Candidatus Izemoplasmatales bacterium]
MMRDTEWIKTGLFAHRGLHSEDGKIPENSMAAFRLAIEKGYGLEMDLNVLKDGTVVVFHDKTFKRMCGDDRKLFDVTLEEARKLRLNDTDETIPTLTEFLKMVDGRVPLLIEFKYHGSIELLCAKAMEILKDYKGVWAMHSFHPQVLLWFRKNHPEILRGVIAEYFLEETDMKKITKFIMKRMLLNAFTRPDFINYNLRDMPNRFLNRAKKRGLTVIGYKARTMEEFAFVKKYYDNAVFEFIEP